MLFASNNHCKWFWILLPCLQVWIEDEYITLLSSLEVEELHTCLKYYTSKALQVGNTRDEEVGVEAYKYLHIEKEHCAFLAHPTRRVMWAIAITFRPSSFSKHFNLLLENHWSKWDQTWQECSFSWSNQVLLLSLRSVIQHGCQGP
jgi:hypothetical protein